MQKKFSGVYRIEIGDKFYIGSSKHIFHRGVQHYTKLLFNQHYNCFLQRAFNKLRKKKIRLVIMELTDHEHLAEREQYYISTYYPELQFNIHRIATRR